MRVSAVAAKLPATVGEIDATAALHRFRLAHPNRIRRPLALKQWWVAVPACLAVVAILFAFTPANAWAQRFLQLLRVQKIAVVPVDLSSLAPEGSPHGKLLAQLISDQVTVTEDPGRPVPASSVEEASRQAGFNVRELKGWGEPAARILVDGPGALQMTLDRERIAGVLEAVGRSDISLPAAADGATVSVKIPKGVHMLYGACGKQEDSSTPCVSFFQIPTPVVTVPPGVSVAALAEAGLQLGGMSASEAHEFCKTVDWASTLVVPIPSRTSSSQIVAVDGVTGTLVEISSDKGGRDSAALMWVKNGIVYSLHTRGSGNTLLAAAAGLQ